MAADYGFIYILGNDCMPGIYKIGFTASHPKIRVGQLSSATACPIPFDLLATFGAENPHAVEQEIHKVLAPYRLNDSREFFEITAAQALDICRQFGDRYDDIFQTTRLEYLVEEEDRKEEVRWKRDYFASQNADPIFWPEKTNRGFN